MLAKVFQSPATLLLAIVLALYWPWSPQSTDWVELLVLLAVAAGVPIVWFLLFSENVPALVWGAGGALILAFQLEAGGGAGFLAACWVISACYALYQYGGWRTHSEQLRSGIALAWLVAAIWSVIHVVELRPLGFSSIIILLTAAHFHYAGVILLALSALLYRACGKPEFYHLGLFTILGLGLVAISITLTQVWGWMVTEAWSSMWMGAAGVMVGSLHFRLGIKEKRSVQFLWCAGGAMLIAGMVLAITYGLRAYFPSLSLSLTAMYRWHGTCNALALFSLLIGWYLKKAQPRIKLRGCPKNQLQKGG